MPPCQWPRRHLFNPSNLKAAIPVAARCERGEPIYLRPRLVAKLSSCSRPWGAVFTVWLVHRCHYSCLWQRVRGQGVGWSWVVKGWGWGGGERWRMEWAGVDFCGGIKLTIGAAASFECPRSSPQPLQGDPRAVETGGAAGIQRSRWHRL